MFKRGWVLVVTAMLACGDDGESAQADAAEAGTVQPDDAGTVDASRLDASFELDARVDASLDARVVDAAVDAGPPLSYAADVAPIFARYCTACHAPGGEGPFSLDTYETTSDLANAAYAAASSRIMPPCAVTDPGCGPTTPELGTLLRWIQQGRPRGN